MKLKLNDLQSSAKDSKYLLRLLILRCRTENEFSVKSVKVSLKLLGGIQSVSWGVMKKVYIRVLTIIIKKSLTIKGLKFKDSNVVFGAMFAYSLYTGRVDFEIIMY